MPKGESIRDVSERSIKALMKFAHIKTIMI